MALCTAFVNPSAVFSEALMDYCFCCSLASVSSSALCSRCLSSSFVYVCDIGSLCNVSTMFSSTAGYESRY